MARLGSGPVRELFETGYLSQVLGLELEDGRHVVVKLRPWADRLIACLQVHEALFRAGYPCPEPLTALDRLDGWAVSAEVLVEPQEQLEPGEDSPELFADALQRLVAQAPLPPTAPSLMPAPPWADPMGDRAGLWPPADDRPIDLNVGPVSWIDRAAANVREFLVGTPGDGVVGHLDWYSANLGWRDRELVAVFDWDSVGIHSEPVIAGLAGAVWPGIGPGEAATVQQTERFLERYAQTRQWAESDWHAAWAAGVWVRCFDAKKAQIDGQDPHTVITRAQTEQRLRMAGLSDAL